MRKRAQVRAVPERPPFISAEVPGLDSTAWFRLPRPTQMKSVFGDYVELFDKDGLKSPECADLLPAACAKALASMWAHPELDLESDPTDGLAVLDELYDYGVLEVVVVNLATALFTKCTDRLIEEKEVAGRLDFFGGPTSEPSTQTSSTSNALAGPGTTAPAEPGTS